jgi:hypothetical protein
MPPFGYGCHAMGNKGLFTEIQSTSCLDSGGRQVLEGGKAAFKQEELA